MPVNTAALKTFAPAMRRQLLEAVGRKLDLLLNSQTPDTLSTYAKQIAQLREQEAENREQLLERVAYTWFNRLCALRYLDARGWHPFGCKVLMPAADGETQPELLKLMRAASLPGELKTHTNEARLHGLLDGQIPPAMAGSDPQGEVYRELVLASCRSYHQLLPELFEGLDDASELLLPDDLLSEGSIAGGFRNAISDADCEDVEIIGWLYQFYISEKKDQVIGKVVKSEDIPAATQLFTPNWIVKYMVQNTIGATWLATYPASPLKSQMEYYIAPAEQTEEGKAQLLAITPESLNPQELTLIDPACGSGHILVEGYELFKAIYLEHGYQLRDIPQLILEKNLYGLDIDERAAQLTIFALMVKGRGDDRRLFERGVKLNVMALVNSDDLDVVRLASAVDFSDYGLKLEELAELKKIFTHATTFGSLIQIQDGLANKLQKLQQLAEATAQDLMISDIAEKLGPIVHEAKLLAGRYDAVVANPPYMGGRYMNPSAKEFASNNFSACKSDLFACFIERGYTLAKNSHPISMVTMHSWMFLSSFQEMREQMLQEKTILSMAHFGPRAFTHASALVVQTTAFTIRNSIPGRFRSVFIGLQDGGEQEKSTMLKSGQNRFEQIDQSELAKIPGSPIAYWASKRITEIFEEGIALQNYASLAVGLQTGSNESFVRLWSEVALCSCKLDCSNAGEARLSKMKWFPYNKGGEFRKWSGNSEHLVNWEADGRAIRAFGTENGGKARSPAQNTEFYFRPSLTWSFISLHFGVRYSPAGAVFDVAGSSAFLREEDYLWVAGFLCSNLAVELMKVLNPTLNFQVGNVSSLPVLRNQIMQKKTEIDAGVKALVEMAKHDWDAYERSWYFKSFPLLSSATTSSPNIESRYNTWMASNKQNIAEMKRLEEENNKLFIEAYCLQDELSQEVPIEQITLTVNPAYRYGGNLTEDELWIRFRQDTIKELLSYANGCMMGRYSLDHPGLILADSRDSQAAQLAAYEEKVGKPLSEVQFKPDPNGIIPVLDGEWFEDDIVARTREFLEVTFPESTVTENLRFIEESLGKDVRKYFCSEFYKDHLQTYKKRPIYWMVQSPKKGFSCLIYLHRYTKDTLNQVLNNYFRPYLQKLEARLAQLGLDQLNDDLPTRERTAARKEAEKITKVLKECQAWEQDALLPLAQQRIELDLDDGVKVNYLKLQDVLAVIPGLAAKED
jgi:type II restriction/modification system DNA methylase subunit YeeA